MQTYVLCKANLEWKSWCIFLWVICEMQIVAFCLDRWKRIQLGSVCVNCTYDS